MKSIVRYLSVLLFSLIFVSSSSAQVFSGGSKIQKGGYG